MITGDYECAINDPDISLSISVKIRGFVNDLFRHDVGFYGKIRIEDAGLGIPISPYMYDKKSDCNKVAGITHRFGRKMPQDTASQAEFYKFAVGFIKRYVPQLVPEDVPSFEEWLESTNHSGERKKQLYEARSEVLYTVKSMCNSKSFIKDEGYGEMKNPRIINSPSDHFKAIIQPLQKAADKRMFTDPVMSKWFIKGTDPSQWVKRMEDTFGGQPVINTDFKSFECHHRGPFAKVIWFWQMHMFRNLFISRAHKNMICRVILGTNVNKMGNLSATIDETLMSGVPWTSSANAILNLTMNAYFAMKVLHPQDSVGSLVRHAADFRALFEGDDGLFENVGQTEQQAKDLGVLLTFSRAPDYSTAKFCSMVVPRGETTLSYDFKKAMINFTILPVKYAGARESICNALIRAKALSYRHMYGHSPIVGELACKLLELTRGVDVSCVLDVLDDRKKEILKAAMTERTPEGKHTYHIRPNVSWAARCNYELVFGISPEEQLDIERQIRESEGPALKLNIQGFFDRQQIDMSLAYQFDTPGEEYFPLRANAYVRSVIENDLKGTGRYRCERVDRGFDPCAVPPGYGG